LTNPSAFDQAPNPPHQSTSDWLVGGTGVTEGVDLDDLWFTDLVNFDPSPTQFHGDTGNTLGLDSGTTTSSLSTVTNSSDMTTHAGDIGSSTSRSSFAAMHVFEMFQRLEAKQREYAMKVQLKEKEDKIAELKNELNEL